MANNQTPKLRAFVRIDGTGRVIPGAPIFQANKPKVGQWREIPLYYRGVPTSSTTSTTTATPSTTTTTTTLPSTTTTTTTAAPVYSFVVYSPSGATVSQGCSLYENGLPNTLYSNVQTLVSGSMLYTDSSLTSPFDGDGVGRWFSLNNNGIISSIEIGYGPTGNTGLVLSAPQICP